MTTIEKSSCNVSKALEYLRDVVVSVNYQKARKRRSEKNKIEYLYEAAVGAEYAKKALGKSFENTSFCNVQQVDIALGSV